MTIHTYLTRSMKLALMTVSLSALAVGLPACSGAQDKPQVEAVIQTPHMVEVEKMAVNAGTTQGEFRSGVMEQVNNLATKEQTMKWRSGGYNIWKAENFDQKFEAQFDGFYQYGLANLDKRAGFDALLMALHVAGFSQDPEIMGDIHQRLYENYSDVSEYTYALKKISGLNGGAMSSGFSISEWQKAHPDSKNMYQDSRLDREAYVVNLLNRVAEKTTNAGVKNLALVSLGTYLGRSIESMDIKDLDAVATQRKRAVSYLETAIAAMKKQPLDEVFAKDIKVLAAYETARITASPPPQPLPPGRVMPEPAPEYTLLQRAENALYVVQGVSVGSYLPETIGVDLQGNPQDIAQYKGRVLLVDFWATWCGPCIAKFPHFRELKKQYADRPFEILGISADDTIEIVHEFLEDNDAPWDMWYSGRSGGVREKWQSYGLPQMYIVDHTGKIRAVYLDGEAKGMDDIVASLVKVAEKAKM